MQDRQGEKDHRTEHPEIHRAFWNFVSEAVHPIGSGVATVMTLSQMNFATGSHLIVQSREDIYKLLICMVMNFTMGVTSISAFLQYDRYHRIVEKHKNGANWRP